jgi:hypothetical protein
MVQFRFHQSAQDQMSQRKGHSEHAESEPPPDITGRSVEVLVQLLRNHVGGSGFWFRFVANGWMNGWLVTTPSRGAVRNIIIPATALCAVVADATDRISQRRQRPISTATGASPGCMGLSGCVSRQVPSHGP